METFFIHQQRLFNAFLALSLRKKNHFVRKLRARRQKPLQRKPRSVWYKIGCNDEFWQNFLNGKHYDQKWVKTFRLTKDKFYELLEMLRPYVSPDETSPNHRKLDAAKRIAVCLYHLRDTGSMWMTANTFGIHQSTVSMVVVEICDAIKRILGQQLLYMPKTEEDIKKKVTCMELKFGMPQALGPIDGTHIPNIRPPESSQDYFNYKHFSLYQFRQFVITKGYLWTLIVDGLDLCMMQKFLQIHKVAKTCPQAKSQLPIMPCCLVDQKSLTILLGILLIHLHHIV